MRLQSSECVGALSRKRRILRFCLWQWRSNFFKQSPKILVVIQAFSLHCQSTGRSLMLLKQRDCLIFLMARIRSFSHSILAPRRKVRHSFDILMTWHSSSLLTKDLTGRVWQNMPVSSALNTSLGLYPSSKVESLVFESSHALSKALSDSPDKALNLIPLRILSFWN